MVSGVCWYSTAESFVHKSLCVSPEDWLKRQRGFPLESSPAVSTTARPRCLTSQRLLETNRSTSHSTRRINPRPFGARCDDLLRQPRHHRSTQEAHSRGGHAEVHIAPEGVAVQPERIALKHHAS